MTSNGESILRELRDAQRDAYDLQRLVERGTLDVAKRRITYLRRDLAGTSRRIQREIAKTATVNPG